MQIDGSAVWREFGAEFQNEMPTLNSMAKILELLSCNEKVTISTNHCLNSINENVVFTVEIPHTVLRKWHNLREDEELKKHTNVGILNALIQQYRIITFDALLFSIILSTSKYLVFVFELVS